MKIVFKISLALMTVFGTSVLFLPTSEAGVLTRARGEAAALHRTSKVLSERICYLDGHGETAAVAEQLLQSTCQAKDLVYADAHWSQVDASVNQIAIVFESLVCSVRKNCVLQNDRRTLREIEIFSDRLVYLRRDLARAIEHASQYPPARPSCGVNAQPPAFAPYPTGYRIGGQTIARTQPSLERHLVPPQNHGPFDNFYGQRPFESDAVVSPRNRIPAQPFGPQIQVHSSAGDIKSEILRMILARMIQ